MNSFWLFAVPLFRLLLCLLLYLHNYVRFHLFSFAVYVLYISNINLIISASNPESKECPYSGKYTIENRHQRTVRSPHKRDKKFRSKREKAMFEHNRRVNGTRLFNFSVRNMSETPILRSRRQLDGNDVSCSIGNYNRLEVGCNTAKNMEFYSTCENKELVTGVFKRFLSCC